MLRVLAGGFGGVRSARVKAEAPDASSAQVRADEPREVLVRELIGVQVVREVDDYGLAELSANGRSGQPSCLVAIHEKHDLAYVLEQGVLRR